MDTITYEFNEHKIEFQLNGDKDVKVNATQMAKIFSKDVPDFLILRQTENFISECLNNRNSGYLNVKTKNDLIISKQKSGTYMHRVLALKFAAWLNPAFELWIYTMIEKLIFGHFDKQQKRLENRARRLNKIAELEILLIEDDNFREFSKLIQENKKDSYMNRSENSQQLNMLKQLFNQKQSEPWQ